MRFLKILGWIFLYFIAWALILLIGIFIIGDENESAFVVFALISLFVIFISFIFYLNFAIRRTFLFKGEGSPRSFDELKDLIKSINTYDIPIMVQEKGNRLIITWKYVDAKWWEFFAKSGMTGVYQLLIKFQKSKHTVILVDITKTVDWSVGPTSVELKGGFFRGVISAIEIGKAFGIKENFELGTIYDYKFKPSEIKNPVLNSIIRAGWDVRFGMW